MTHSHALDQTLCEEILKRTDFAYFGLIGSKTKRARLNTAWPSTASTRPGLRK